MFTSRLGTHRYAGCAQEENIEYWLTKGWRLNSLDFESFKEGNNEFRLGKNQEIQVITRVTQLKIVTRKPITRDEEIMYGHNRLPRVITRE